MNFRRRKQPAEGVALLMVVLVLAMLTIVGVLFSLTVSIHLKTNIQYRERAEVQSAALSGLHRFAAELMYNVWGTDEIRAFTCDDGTPLAVPFGTAVGPYSFGTYVGADPTDPDSPPPVAYYKSATDPAGEAGDTAPLTRPWSAYTRSVTNVDYGDYGQPGGSDYKGNEDDYRWMVSASVWGGNPGNGVIAERFWDARTASGNPRAVCSGGLYHDEFLPTGLSNNDLFELALHYNHGTVCGRTMRYGLNEGADNAMNNMSMWDPLLGGLSNSTPAPFWSWSSVASGGHRIGYNGSRKMREPIDTRMVGDSFYRIFRFDLVDQTDFKVRGTGVDPDLPSRYYSEEEIYSRDNYVADGGDHLNRALHLGDATGVTTSGSHPYYHYKRQDYYVDAATSYTDPLGGGININQVNLNYDFELYYDPFYVMDVNGGNRIGTRPWERPLRHYNESKWIYLYDRDDPEMPPWARFALYVWPDAGLPSANFQASDPACWGYSSSTGGVLSPLWNMRANGFFYVLDTGPGESGSPPAGTSPKNDGTVTFISPPYVFQNTMGNFSFYNLRDPGYGWDHYNRNDKYPGKIMTWFDRHRRRLGAFNSRTELEVLLRKHVFQDTLADLESRRVSAIGVGQQRMFGQELTGLQPEDMRFLDAEIIAHHYTVNGYTYLLDPHWETDRLVLDARGIDDDYIKANDVSANYRKATSPRDATSFSAREGGNQARARLCDLLSEFKDFYGPYAADNANAAKPGAPSPAYATNYGAIGALDGSHLYVGAHHAKRAKAMFLSTLLNSTYCTLRYHAYYRQRFAVNQDDPAGELLPNPMPEDMLFSSTPWCLEDVTALRINEMGAGVFTVPIGPKLLDPDFYLTSPAAVGEYDWLKPTRLDDGENHKMPYGPVEPAGGNYDHRYGFETKSMNFIELVKCTSVTGSSLSNNWFLRVYGNVKNWDGKCVDAAGNNTPAVAGGSGYIDLFAKVKRVEETPGVDANDDGDYDDAGDTVPVYNVDPAAKGWIDGTYYDPDHYIEGVTVRYYGGPATGDVDNPAADGFYGQRPGGQGSDTNGDGHWSFDREWTAAYPKPTADITAINNMIKAGDPEPLTSGTVTYEAGTWKHDGHLMNVDGIQGDYLPDEDWGSPRTQTNHPPGFGGACGSTTPDGKIDSIWDDWFWKARGDLNAGGQPFYEDLADWLNYNRSATEEVLGNGTIIKDKLSERSWSKVKFGFKSSVAAVFGNYTKFNVFGRTFDENSGRYSGGGYHFLGHYVWGECYPPKVGEPGYGSYPSGGAGNGYGTDDHSDYAADGMDDYILVLFPHARTPWTRRNPDYPNPNTTNDNGVGHFDDTTKYQGTPNADGLMDQDRPNNYADGDMVVLGTFTDDYYHGQGNHVLNIPNNDAEWPNGWRKVPRVANYVKLNGTHPDFAAAGGSAGPGCHFKRTGATISGAGGSTGTLHEDLPFGRSRDIRGSFGTAGVYYGWSARDPRDNTAPWCWDFTAWNWSGDGPVAGVDRPSPAYTTYDVRKIDWHSFVWQDPPVADDAGVGPDPSGCPRRGRFDWHVHGRNFNYILRQADQGDPAVTPGRTAQDLALPDNFLYWLDSGTKYSLDTQTAGDEKGRFPFVIAGLRNARASRSQPIVSVLDRRLNAFARGDRFWDKTWLSNVALDTRDLRLRSWWDLMQTTRCNEYLETDAVDPAAQPFCSALCSPIQDHHDNNMTGAKEGFTTQPLSPKRLVGGAWQDTPPGRYWADRKVVGRININEVASPIALQAMGLAGGMSGIYSSTGSEYNTSDNFTVAQMSLLGQKPLRGYTNTFSWMRRTATIGPVRSNILWSDNLWASAVIDYQFYSGTGTSGYKAFRAFDEEGWAQTSTVSPSPVYTAYILAQRLDDGSGKPISEVKLRVTVERTWDGKLNITDFRLTPQE